MLAAFCRKSKMEIFGRRADGESRVCEHQGWGLGLARRPITASCAVLLAGKADAALTIFLGSYP